MIALDTNILVRLFVEPADDQERSQQGVVLAHLESAQSFFVPLSVSLELAWVLGKVYRCDAEVLRDMLDHLTRLANVDVEAAADLMRAADMHVAGLDFADALHCARSAQCSALLTFDDRRFARKAKRLAVRPSVVVPKAK
ncbi:MAG: type II toxin-antitoxin system VapC family toxin [Immundisolibacter sp.]|uniref:type II toxin-antitoxin system VapC family toxin n=1 Tax=Immundisolibacter sp. TaxID=1934948 RepID=UPI003EE141E2